VQPAFDKLVGTVGFKGILTYPFVELMAIIEIISRSRVNAGKKSHLLSICDDLGAKLLKKIDSIEQVEVQFSGGRDLSGRTALEILKSLPNSPPPFIVTSPLLSQYI